MKIKFTFLLILFSIFSFSQNEFITLWKPSMYSNAQSTNTQVVFSAVGSNYTIYWEEVGNPSHNGTLTNVYSYSGAPVKIDFGKGSSIDAQYILKVSNGNGTFLRMINYFGDQKKLLEVKQWGDIKWQTMESSFIGCTNLDVTATDIPDLSICTDLNFMFYECTNLKGNPTFGLWDTSNILKMHDMFRRAVNFNQNIGNWNTSKVTDMGGMFQGSNIYLSKFNQDIGNWDTSNVTDMAFMFNGATSFNQSLEKWNLKSIKYNNFSYTLYGMFGDSNLSCQNYDKTLIGWANNPDTATNLNFTFNTKMVYSSQAALNARDYLINTKKWAISFDTYDPSCALKTEENKIIKIQVYPNPAKEFISIENLKNNTDIEIYDMQGKLVKREKYNTSQISLKNLSRGVYILKIPSENYSQKLIVE